MIKLMLTRMMELAVNNVLSLNPAYYKVLEVHQGKVLKLDLTDLNQQLYFSFQPNNIYICSNFMDQTDTSLSGSSFAFLKQLTPTNDLDLIKVEGNIELAHDLQLLLKELDATFVEYFSYLFGDFTVHKAQQTAENLRKNLSIAKKRTLEDLLDYIQEEKRFIPSREEVEDFYDDLLGLRHDIERLEIRLKRLGGE